MHVLPKMQITFLVLGMNADDVVVVAGALIAIDAVVASFLQCSNSTANLSVFQTQGIIFRPNKIPTFEKFFTSQSKFSVLCLVCC